MSTDSVISLIRKKANSEAITELYQENKTEPINTRGLAFIKNFFADRNSVQRLKEDAVYTSVERLRDKLPPEAEAELYTDVITDSLFTKEQVYGMLNSRAYLDIYYRKVYEGLREAYPNKAGNVYKDLQTEIDDHYYDSVLSEIFVRLAEERGGIAITSAKQLQTVTGVRNVENTFIWAMDYRYEQALLGILDKGGNYGDLLDLSPAKFNVPDYHRDSSIEEAIYQYFYLMDTSTARPNIKDIAEILGAPYETVYQASQRHTLKPLPWKQQD